MRFVQFIRDGLRRIGVELSTGGSILDLNAANPSFPNDMRSFLSGGQSLVLAAKSAVESGDHVIDRSSVKLIAPITNPDKVLCVGMNYIDHCMEQNYTVPEEPVIFNKFPSSIIASGDDLVYPDETKELDWEVELVIVIGKEAKNIKKADAMNYVFGFTVAHDVSARDWQMKKNGGQWLLGKAMDCFCPLGPAIVMKEDIKNVHNLRLTCRVNDITKQDGNTNNLVHQTEDIVSFISRFFTLKPGDIILTGTPPGVGVFRKPPEFLQRGDIVECEIEEIGKLVNKVV